ncbi:MAG TPA: hypothetical protein VGK30_00635 [Candidatus Binatia bacterium]|jgi:hypothetical protein
MVVLATMLCAPAGGAAAIRPIAERRRAEGRAASRARGETDVVPNVGECDSPKGSRAYGSPQGCLRALCRGRNLVNAFVTDDAHRLRRNPCAGVDPFDRP